MSGFSLSNKFETEFEGDKVTLELNRLKRRDFLRLTPFIDVDDDGKVKMSREDNQAFSEEAIKILPNYVNEFDGLNDRDGNKLSLKTVLEHAYFGDLISEIVKELFIISNMGEDKANEIKNSDALPEQDTTEQHRVA